MGSCPASRRIWAGLKQFETFLKIKERRDRFTEACLKGTEWEPKSHLFREWSLTLYESRWHEVAAFVDGLQDLLPVMAATFDVRKYNALGKGERRKQEVRERASGDGDGGPALDINVIHQRLQSQFFHKYTQVISLIHRTPELLAAWGERCPCHECYFHKLSEYAFKQTMTLHFWRR